MSEFARMWIWAAYLGDLEGMKRLLAEGSVNARTVLPRTGDDARLGMPQSGDTALMAASKSGRLDVMRWLLTNEAKGEETIHAANVQNHGYQALHYAVENNQIEAVNLLERHGADIYAVDQNGSSVLHIAVKENHHEMVAALLQLAADKSCKNKEGRTAFELARFYGRTECQQLLQPPRRSHTSASVATGMNSALQSCSDGASPVSASPILTRSSSASVSTAYPRSQQLSRVPMEQRWVLAARGGNLHEMKQLVQQNLVNLETAAVATVNSADGIDVQKGDTALMVACKANQSDVVYWLVKEVRADVHHQNRENQNFRAIHYAARLGRSGIVLLLLLQAEWTSADIDAITEDGSTALHIAVRYDHVGVVQELIARGANVNLKTMGGKTPLHYAAENGNKGIIRLLVANGANPYLTDAAGISSRTIIEDRLNARFVEELDNQWGFSRNANVSGWGLDRSSPLPTLRRGDAEAGHERQRSPIPAMSVSRLGSEARLGQASEPIPQSAASSADGKAEAVDEALHPLHAAVLSRSMHQLQSILAQQPNIDINARDSNGNTALIIAAQNEFIQAMRFLIKNEADLNSQNMFGNTALHEAAYHGKPESIQLLVQAGAKRSIRNWMDPPETAKELADQFHQAQIRDELQAALRKPKGRKRARSNSPLVQTDEDSRGEHEVNVTATVRAAAAQYRVGRAPALQSMAEDGLDLHADALSSNGLPPRAEPPTSRVGMIVGSSEPVNQRRRRRDDAASGSAEFREPRAKARKPNPNALADSPPSGAASSFAIPRPIPSGSEQKTASRADAGSNRAEDGRTTPAERAQTLRSGGSNRGASIQFQYAAQPMDLSESPRQVRDSTRQDFITELIEQSLPGAATVALGDIYGDDSMNEPVILKGDTALMAACRHDKPKLIKRLLALDGIDCKAYANYTNPHNGKRAIHYAAERGHAQPVRMLLDNGGDHDVADASGQAALMYAVQNRHESVIDMLLNHENNPSRVVSSELRRTVLHVAVIFNHQAAVRRLLELSHHDIDAADVNGMTALHHAVRCGHTELVELLINHHAKVNAADHDGFTPLHFAACHRDCSVMQLLLNSGAKLSVNATNRNRRTPLHEAALHGCHEAFEVLIAHRALRETRDKCGDTADDIVHRSSVAAPRRLR